MQEQGTMTREKIYIYGKHALTEAIETVPHIIQKVFLAPGALPAQVTAQLKELNINVGPLSGQAGVAKDANHQGVIGVIDTSKLVMSFEDFLKNVQVTPDTALVLMDELQDPHNVGAIIRSAAGFGISGILMPERNQVQITGAVVKTSAGMAFRVPIVSIGNVNNAVRTLKEKGFWIYGLAMKGATNLHDEKFNAPAVFVVGNEGEGIHQKTLEHCDVKLKIPMHSRTESLNAAVSTAVVLYEWSRQHPQALK
jgi:23S rRNA (guanosine2251-2'-O)-methyltransferase